MSNAVNQHRKQSSPRGRLSRAQTRRLAEDLLTWFEARQRDLPWRHRRDPYAIWVSEVMLQQTRVDAVIAPYGRFLRRFPDVQALAAAEEAEVLAQWAGLGYYRRARQLHAAARRIVEQCGGKFPRRAAALRLLPGFGPYTAGAVASIAFGEEVPAIDGNVQRVICRLVALDGDPARSATALSIEELVRALLRGSPPDRLNQALMELGALVCTPRDPKCEECPWFRRCIARRDGIEALLPRRAPRPAASQVSCYAAVVRRQATYLWRRRPAGGHNAGLWEFPTTAWHGGHPDAQRAMPALSELGRELERSWVVGEALAGVRHSITRYRIRCVGHQVEDESDSAGEGLCWATPDEARRLGLTSAARKLLDALPSLI